MKLPLCSISFLPEKFTETVASSETSEGVERRRLVEGEVVDVVAMLQ